MSWEENNSRQCIRSWNKAKEYRPNMQIVHRKNEREVFWSEVFFGYKLMHHAQLQMRYFCLLGYGMCLIGIEKNHTNWAGEVEENIVRYNGIDEPIDAEGFNGLRTKEKIRATTTTKKHDKSQTKHINHTFKHWGNIDKCFASHLPKLSSSGCHICWWTIDDITRGCSNTICHG